MKKAIALSLCLVWLLVSAAVATSATGNPLMLDNRVFYADLCGF